MLILLMTGLATLIQMKNHPIILSMVNNTEKFNKEWVRNLKFRENIVQNSNYNLSK